MGEEKGVNENENEKKKKKSCKQMRLREAAGHQLIALIARGGATCKK